MMICCPLQDPSKFAQKVGVEKKLKNQIASLLIAARTLEDAKHIELPDTLDINLRGGSVKMSIKGWDVGKLPLDNGKKTKNRGSRGGQGRGLNQLLK